MKNKISTSLIGILILLLGCNSSPEQLNSLIKEKIKKYYKAAEIVDYKPINFTELDTVHYYDGYLQARIKHTFQARNRRGHLGRYSHWFKVTIYNDEVVVLPENEKYFLSGNWKEEKATEK